ncbi:MAG TPA: hypothetical protein DCQ98_16365 [Planctomycetaceae bacterium]|nr:hypothetical protein [Planctomycetaceae bacterium]
MTTILPSDSVTRDARSAPIGQEAESPPSRRRSALAPLVPLAYRQESERAEARHAASRPVRVLRLAAVALADPATR